MVHTFAVFFVPRGKGKSYFSGSVSEGEIDVRRLRANQSGVTENGNFSNGREAWHLSVFQASQHIYNVARAVPHCRYVVLFDWVNSR